MNKFGIYSGMEIYLGNFFVGTWNLVELDRVLFYGAGRNVVSFLAKFGSMV